jgi:hypothetical protein
MQSVCNYDQKEKYISISHAGKVGTSQNTRVIHSVQLTAARQPSV